MSNDQKRPSWVPEGGGEGFACSVMDGVAAGHDGIRSCKTAGKGKKKSKYSRPKLTPAQLAEGVLNTDRGILGRAITLAESNLPAHTDEAQEVLKTLLPHTGKSIRVGITGVPGVGKSTFIESLGYFLINNGYKVAVLAVDPSSSKSGGSILGDKTRMERIGRDERCFIRPSPSGGTLGGVARKTRETMLICEAAGFDVILIETVGVGQSETTVRSMSDFFLLLMLAGAGDELQGIKKGIMELADALIINKADGDNKLAAEMARNEYERAMHYLQPSTEGWTSHAFTCSAKKDRGIEEIWQVILKFKEITGQSGVFDNHRRQQNINWVHDMVDEHLRNLFIRHPKIAETLPGIEKEVADEVLPAVAAVQKLIKIFEG